MLDCTKEHFDLLLFDHELRNMNGLELTRRVRRMSHRKATPLTLISLEDLTEEAREAGADAFLRKPNNLIELIDTDPPLASCARRGLMQKKRARVPLLCYHSRQKRNAYN